MDEQVLEIEGRPREERRIREEVDGVGRNLASDLDEQQLVSRPRTKDVSHESPARASVRRLELLEARERLHELEECAGVSGARATD